MKLVKLLFDIFFTDGLDYTYQASWVGFREVSFSVHPGLNVRRRRARRNLLRAPPVDATPGTPSRLIVLPLR